jgi:hypothetical protein
VGQVGAGVRCRSTAGGEVGLVGSGAGVRSLVYYVGRFAQLVGMSLLIGDVVTAGPLGPDPRLFGAGVVVFLVGWGLTRLTG